MTKRCRKNLFENNIKKNSAPESTWLTSVPVKKKNNFGSTGSGSAIYTAVPVVFYTLFPSPPLPPHHPFFKKAFKQSGYLPDFLIVYVGIPPQSDAGFIRI